MKSNLLKSLLTVLTLGCCATSMSAAGSRFAVLIGYNSVENIDNYQEYAAAKWFTENYTDGTVITPENSATSISINNVDCIWIHIDRLNVGKGNLPEAFSNATTIAALTEFVNKGGSLYLTKQATQLLPLLNRISSNFAPNIYGDGEGATGTDVWTVNAQIGYWFNQADTDHYSPEQFYDHRSHAIYQGLIVNNDYTCETYGLLGTGTGDEMWREDHNCLWDLNAYTYTADGQNTVEKFENENSATVIGTWGHVVDHAVAGIVEFHSTTTCKGSIIANGLAAYEWAPRSGVNAYADNIKLMTKNSLNYLATLVPQTTALLNVINDQNSAAPSVYYNLQGIQVSENNLTPGVYVLRQGNSTKKVLVK